MSLPGFEEVIKKIRDIEVGHAHLREEISLLNNAWPPRWALQGPETPMQSLVPNRDRTLDLMEDFYFNILESMGQAVIGYDLDCRVFYWNHYAEKLFDCPREEAIGSDVLSILVNPKDYDVAFTIINGVKQGMTWVGQFPIQLRTGKKILAIVTVDPFYDDDDTLVGITCVLVDAKPYFEIQYSMLEARDIVSDQISRRSRSIVTSKLGQNCTHPLQTAIASKLTILATKFNNKVRSKMKTGEKDVSRASGSGESHLCVHDNEDDGSRIEASTPKRDFICCVIGTFLKFVKSQRETNDEGEGKKYAT